MTNHAGFPLSRVLPAILAALLLLSLCACGAAPQDGIFLQSPEENPYTQVAESILPEEAIQLKRSEPYWYLEAGGVIEANETQAASALEALDEVYWYPQFLSTAVIVADRDQTAAEITGWRDLSGSGETVSFWDNTGLLLSAMSYGLEGERYSLKSALNMLAELGKAGRLKKNDLTAPLIICLDDQAAQLIKAGRNLEVIVPAEGSFTYVRGLLSPKPLRFSGDVEAALLSAGLRLLDGRCDEALYPDAAAYETAHELGDTEHFLRVKLDETRTLRREVWHVRLYTGADGREHQFLALLYIAVISVWTATVIRRAMQKSVRRGALAACGILLLWITVRMVKYQTSSLVTWDRFLWFSYLGFQLALMFTLFWMAWSIDQPEGRRAPKWLWLQGACNLALALMVLTNDWHGFVYLIDFANPVWRDDYGYAAGYHIITAVYMLEFAAANVMLLIKSLRNPSKKGLVFSLLLCVLIVVYRFGYIARVPLMRESDLTMVTGVFVLLFFESAMRAGMIPINSKYTAVFSNATLRMQLLGPDGAVALASASATDLDEGARKHVCAGTPQPLLLDENTLLYGSAITGGFVAWQEDISALNRLHRETEESIRKLKAANAFLAEEERVKRSLNEAAERLRLMERLEGEIAMKTERLMRMIHALDAAEDPVHEAARVALLLCYIKRRCNLFFRAQETEQLSADELTMYVDEIAALSSHAKVNIAPVSQLTGELPVQQGTLLYDFYCEIVSWAAEQGCPSMLRHLGRDEGAVVLRLMPSADVRLFEMEEALAEAIAAAGGAVALKDLDDVVGISLSFPDYVQGGEACV